MRSNNKASWLRSILVRYEVVAEHQITHFHQDLSRNLTVPLALSRARMVDIVARECASPSVQQTEYTFADSVSFGLGSLSCLFSAQGISSILDWSTWKVSASKPSSGLGALAVRVHPLCCGRGGRNVTNRVDVDTRRVVFRARCTEPAHWPSHAPASDRTTRNHPDPATRRRRPEGARSGTQSNNYADATHRSCGYWGGRLV